MVNSEIARLEGTWQLRSAMRDGQMTPDDAVQQVRVVIHGARHSVFFGSEVVAHEIPFTVDPTTEPLSTTDTLPDGRHIRGIYRLEGDTLTSCVAEPDMERPSAFEAPTGSGHTLRVFRRVRA